MVRHFTLIIVLSFLFGFSSLASTKNLCDQYRTHLGKLRKSYPNSYLDLKFSDAPSAAEKFDSSWYYVDLGDFILPIPSKPTKVEREPDGGVTIVSKDLTGSIGPDPLMEEMKSLAKFFQAKKVHSSYEYNAFIYDDEFLECSDIKTADDLDAKSKIAAAKSLSAPFKNLKVFNFKDSQAIAFVGQHQSTGKSVLQIIVKRNEQRDLNGLFFLSGEEVQSPLLQLIPKIRDKAFFMSGKSVQLKP